MVSFLTYNSDAMPVFEENERIVRVVKTETKMVFKVKKILCRGMGKVIIICSAE